MNRAFLQQVEDSPVIAAVRDEKALEQSLSSEVGIVFLLGFDIISLPEMTEKVRKAGQLPVVHLDLVAGLSPREEAVRYLREKTAAGGIITTKANLILCAQHMGLGTIQRVFMLDGMALKTITQQKRNGPYPDLVEILPGVLDGRVLRRIGNELDIPFICGGLIHDREDVMNALNAGALAVSSSSPTVWKM